MISERKSKEEAVYDIVSEVTHHHFYHILFTGNKQLNKAHTRGNKLNSTFWRNRVKDHYVDSKISLEFILGERSVDHRVFFLIAIITNYHWLSSLKQHYFLLLFSLGDRKFMKWFSLDQNQDSSSVTLPPETVGENPFPHFFPASRGYLHFGSWPILPFLVPAAY